MTRPLIYVAGPITSDPWGCVGKAMAAWRWLRSIDVVPILPQLSVIAEMVDPQPYEAWMDYDMAVLARCDALLRLHGDSPGADREVEEATRLKIPVFHDTPSAMVEILGWRHGWSAET